jgi:anti-sigma regulatory factor (Ser/Thr protein kinase)
MDVIARPSSVEDVRGAVRGWAVSLPGAVVEDLVLAVSEVVTNGVRHGPDGARIRITAELQLDGVHVQVCDEGRPQVIAIREPDSQGGRGLHIVEAVTKQWGASDSPTCVWFTLSAKPQ